eukprot:610566-Prorocentrum_minimum.AAC.2
MSTAKSSSITYVCLGAACLSLPAAYFFFTKYSALALKSKLEERRRRKAEQALVDLGKREYRYVPIGVLESTYTARNFTPNQPQRAPSSRARLKLDNNTSLFKAGSFDTLEQFSHVWVIFVFHENTNLSVKARILPPRKNDNEKVGAFACRSPMRPNPLGLSLVNYLCPWTPRSHRSWAVLMFAVWIKMSVYMCKPESEYSDIIYYFVKLDKVDIEGGFLYFSSVDLIDGTPVLDIKPYIPTHDIPLGQVRPFCALSSYRMSHKFK